MSSKTYFELLEENEELKKENFVLRQRLAEFDEYKVVQDEIDRNTQERINWKDYLGETLTKKVAFYYATGHDPDEAFREISRILQEKGITDDEVFRRMKIGVCARFGEIRSERNKIVQVRGSA